MHDFEAVGTAELLEVKGGISDATLRRIVRMENDLRRSGTHGIGEDSGGCEGDANGFGGTFDANEVTVTGVYTGPSGNPVFKQGSAPETPDCPECDFSYGKANSSRNWGITWAWYSHYLYNPDGAHRCN